MALKFSQSSSSSEFSDSSDIPEKKQPIKKRTKSKKKKDNDDWIEYSDDENDINLSKRNKTVQNSKKTSSISIKNDIFQIPDDTINTCYTLLKTLENTPKYSRLFSILETTQYLSRNSEAKDLSTIRQMIELGSISTYSEFKSCIISTLKQIREDFGHATAIGELSLKLKEQLNNSFQKFDEKQFQQSFRKGDNIIFQHLSKFSTPFDNKRSLRINEGDTFKTDILEQLKKKLSESKDPKVKLEAEWIIRIYYPTLPYYTMKIDLKELPREAIVSLCSLVGMDF